LQVEHYRGKSAELPNDIHALRIPLRADNLDDVVVDWRKARQAGLTPHVQIFWPQDSSKDLAAGGHVATRMRGLFEELARVDREEFNKPWNRPPEYVGRSCNRHLFACHVTQCGLVFACVGITIPIGDTRTTSLRTILDESEVLENLRDFHTKLKQPCHTCSKSVDCYGCRGAAYQMTGDYLAGDPLCWKTERKDIHPLPILVDNLIPHGPSMRMVRNLVQVGEREVFTDFQIEHDSPWIDSAGRLDDFAYIEMIAQSFAASHGIHLGAGEKQPGWGLLLGIKDLIIHGDARAGDLLTIQIKKATRFGAFGLIEGTVKRDGGPVLATAEIKLWQADEAQKALFP
jgi:radical SAM protein with 4Fe4S-binding SPASM domain